MAYALVGRHTRRRPEKTLSIDVYNTHLEAGGGPEDDAARGAQVDALIAAMADHGEARPIIFLGDTNLEDTDPEDLPLVQKFEEETGLINVCVALDCPEPERIDRIMFRGSADVELSALAWSVPTEFVDSAGTTLSDHDAVLAQLRVTTPNVAKVVVTY